MNKAALLGASLGVVLGLVFAVALGQLMFACAVAL